MFSRLAGNSDVKDALRRMMAADRLPGALLFSGPDGVGKRQFALELAKASLCPKAKDFEACDVCPVCQRIPRIEIPTDDDKNKDNFKRVFSSEHPDVGMAHRYKRFILVDAIRHLEAEANFRPYEGEKRFFIVDEADHMNDAAANALLKTLEEPPATSHIILLTAMPGALLPTIRSRCQTLRFAPVAREEIEQYLKASHSHEDARLAARLSRGSIGRAVSLDLEVFRRQREAMLHVLQSAALRGGLANLLRLAEALNDPKQKDEFEAQTEILQMLISDTLHLKMRARAAEVVNEDVADDLMRIAEAVSTARIESWVNEIELLNERLAVNINRKIAADRLFVQMAGA
jgi:DNA polymerase-3 subunit delta'